MDKIHTIYKITGKCGKGYIGRTTASPHIRWRQHRAFASSGVNYPFYQAVRERGTDWFSVSVLCECFSKREAEVCEKAMIALHGTYYKCNGWNVQYGPGRLAGSFSEEERKKMSDSGKKRHREKPETLKEARDTWRAMGFPISPEGAAAQQKGREKNKGQKRTKEFSENASKRLKGKPIHPNTTAAFIASVKGKPADPKRIEKMTNSMRALFADPKRAAQRAKLLRIDRLYKKALAERIGRPRKYIARFEANLNG